MDEETKKQLELANKTLTELQTQLKTAEADKKTFEEKFNSLTNESKEKVDKIKAALDQSDAILQKKQLELDAHASKIKHLEESINEIKSNNTPETLQRIKDLELDITRLSNLSPADVKGKKKFSGNEYEALRDYVMKGLTPEKVVNISDLKEGESLPTGMKYLRTDNNADGGFLVPEELYNQVVEEVEEINPIRPLCRKFASKVKALSVAIRTTLPTAYYEGEAETDQESEASYRQETLTAYRLGMTSKVTKDSINFSAIDIISQLTKDASMGLAIKEAYCFLLGTGKKQPEGLLTNADVLANVETSSASATVSLIDVIKLAGQIKSGYLPNARFAMNQKTLYTLRTETDGAGNFLWKIGGENMPSNIAGKPFIIMPSMADIAGNSLSVLLGDFFYGYYILDAVGLSLIRDDLSSKRTAMVEFTWNTWNTGQVAIAEAFKVLKTHS